MDFTVRFLKVRFLFIHTLCSFRISGHRQIDQDESKKPLGQCEDAVQGGFLSSFQI